jgi:hypothetical protein
VHSILERVDPAKIVYEPFPYVWVRNALDPSYYAELAAAFPSLERIAGGGPLPNNQVFRSPACDVLADAATPAIWRQFFEYHCSGAFLAEMLAFWRTAIEREYPDIEDRFGKPLAELSCGLRRYRPGKAPENLRENMHSDVTLDTQFVVNSPVTELSTVRGPHLDKPYKLFAGILYMRLPDDPSTGGNLELYRPKARGLRFDRRQHVGEEGVEVVDEVRYEANSLVLWLNTPRALHGVSRRSLTPVHRRYINFIAECYRLRTDTFFSLPRDPWAVVHGLAKSTLRRHLINDERRRDE